MEKTVVTLEIPVDLYASLQALAANKKQNLSDLITHLVKTAYRQEQTVTSTPAFDTLLANATDLGFTDLAEQHDHYLYGVERQ
ncbi:MAG: hypothetical protein Kow0031_25230 [Anaerolineae bacterium]